MTADQATAAGASRSSTLTAISSVTPTDPTTANDNFKPPHQQLDSMSVTTIASSTASTQHPKSVVSLNATTTTTSSNISQYNNNRLTTTFKETAFVLIKRLFGCLSNVNSIKDPQVHKRVIEFIFNKWERLTKVFKKKYFLSTVRRV
jgi:hypothetical protein